MNAKEFQNEWNSHEFIEVYNLIPLLTPEALQYILHDYANTNRARWTPDYIKLVKAELNRHIDTILLE